MNVQLKQIAVKSLLYDGTEDNFNKIYSLTLDNGDTVSFTPMNVIDLENFEKRDNRGITKFLLEKIPTIRRFAPTPEFIYYKNIQGTIPYVKENEKYLAVVSLGETQPARYQVYIEAVFEKQPL